MGDPGAVDLVGNWENQNGSRLRIDHVEANGRFEGTFVSSKGRAEPGRAYPVFGVVNGEVASFTVDFGAAAQDLASITTFAVRWIRAPDGDPRLHTVWVLARQYADAGQTEPTGAWNAFLTNADVFERIESVD